MTTTPDRPYRHALVARLRALGVLAALLLLAVALVESVPQRTSRAATPVPSAGSAPQPARHHHRALADLRADRHRPPAADARPPRVSRHTRPAPRPLTPAQARALGRKMMRAYWPDTQWRYLERLWTRESNWTHGATNPSSGAYGIPQALPATKMRAAGTDWRTNPRTQIAWGLRYIKGRYGSPAAALAFHYAHNWY